VLDSALRIAVANTAFKRLSDDPDLEGKWIYDVQGGAWNTPDFHALLEGAPTSRRVQVDLPGRGTAALMVSGYSLAGDDGAAACRLLVFSEVPLGP
jgi:hypothetical protein